jgi:hypothetical protein
VPAVMELPTLDALREQQRMLRAELARLQRRLRLQLALEFVTDFVLVLLATAAALVFLDWLFRLGLSVRVVLLTLSVAGAAAFLGMRVVQRWRSARIDDLSLAVTLDRYRPGVGQQVADVLQLPGLLDDPADVPSPALVRLAVQRASAALARCLAGLLRTRPD